MSSEQKRILEQQLWKIADTLRGKMNADEFRDYILGFIFYKYLSERMELFANEILAPDKLQYRNLATHFADAPETLEAYIAAVRENTEEALGYFLRPEELFSEVAKRGNGGGTEDNLFETANPNFILGDMEQILKNIQKSTTGIASEEDFDNLFEDMDLNSSKLGKTPDDRNKLIAKVLAHLDRIDFKLEDAEMDVLGDAYEYLIGQFASGAGKKAGEFYTPQPVSEVLARIVTADKQNLRSVYDPTCGSGSLLLRVAKVMREKNTQKPFANKVEFYGQELNRTTYNLARMNMIMHGVNYSEFDIRQENTLERPQHLHKRFEAIVANPPFSAEWSANQLFMSDDRFSQYGRLAPAGKADFAFVQHMIHHLADNGTMAVVLPHGVLFRGGAEQHIRKYLIETSNFLDAVIGLPANIFYGTSIPTCIMVFKKCRPQDSDILFIDASQHFEKVKTQNVLREEHIQKIVQTYSDRQEIEKYSRRASLQTIAENDYNLNIPRYVDTFEAEDSIDINAVSQQIKDLQAEMATNDALIATYCQELGIATPF